MKRDCTERVVILGGGLAGCALAYQLSKRGRKVLLLERRNIASGASGRCGGMIMKIDGRDTDPREIAKRWQYVSENDRMLNNFEAELGVDFGLMRRGSLDIATSDGEMDLLRQIVKVQKEELGDDEMQLLDRPALKKVSPVMSDLCVGARFRPSDGCLDPFKLSHALLNKAIESGNTEVLTRTPADEILFSGHSVCGVRSGDDIFETSTVVNCANGWAGILTKDIPVIPLRSLAVITEPAPPLPALTFEAELHMKIVYGCTQTKRGNILVGGPPERPGTMEEQFEEKVTFKELKFSTSVISELMPALGNLNVIRSWSGAMGSTPDGMPCVGRIGSYDGLYVSAGYANGMSYTPVMGKLLAELIVEGESSIPLDVLSPGRFAGKTYDWPERYDYTILAEFLGRMG